MSKSKKTDKKPKVKAKKEEPITNDLYMNFEEAMSIIANPDKPKESSSK